MKPLLIKLGTSFFIICQLFIPAFTSRSYVIQAQECPPMTLAQKPIQLMPVSPRLFNIETNEIINVNIVTNHYKW